MKIGLSSCRSISGGSAAGSGPPWKVQSSSLPLTFMDLPSSGRSRFDLQQPPLIFPCTSAPIAIPQEALSMRQRALPLRAHRIDITGWNGPGDP